MPRLASLLVALALALTACTNTKPPPDAQSCPLTGLTSVGEALPDCTLTGMPGWPTLRLSAEKGTPLMLNFWASWCTSCIAEMPDIDKVATALKTRLKVIGVDVDRINGETQVDAEHFAKRTGVHYRLAFDVGGELYAHFSARTIMPISVFADANGIVKGLYYGQMDQQILRSNLRKFLNVS
jgi:thiol-disulfide isomerase/thioredoxin